MKTGLTAGMLAFLRGFRDEEVLFAPNPGNAGDSLISVGTVHAFRRAGVAFRPVGSKADIDGRTVFVGGGGNLVPLYGEARAFIETSGAFRRAKRVVILPHTIRGNEDLLREAGDNVTIFARDPETYAHISAHAGTRHVYLDHDMAFHISPTVLFADTSSWSDLPGLFASKSQGYDLKAGQFLRTDGESRGRPIPANNADISVLYEFGTWPENAQKAGWCFLRAIQSAEHVYTDRLHVGIGCALVGKACTFGDNSYGKNSAVFGHSIRKVAQWVTMSRS